MQIPIQNVKPEFAINRIEVRTPTPGVLSNTKSAMDRGNFYEAIQSFLIGCISEIEYQNGNVTESQQEIKSYLRHLPYRSAEFLINSVMIKFHGEENSGIEGAYDCPSCHNLIIARKEFDDTGELISDTLDYISNLPISYTDETTFFYQLNEPVIVKDKEKGTEILNIQSFEFYYPTMQNCINAFNKVGNTNTSKLQLAIFAEAIKGVNGQDIDIKFKSQWAMYILENMPNIKDYAKINEKVIEFGVKNILKKHCPKCGRVFDVVLDTSNFFDTGLQV